MSDLKRWRIRAGETPEGWARPADADRMVVIGPKGAVDFWWMLAPRVGEPIRSLERIGGIEEHSRTDTGHGGHHSQCWALGGPCWHDGSSLYASEYLLPMLADYGEDEMWSVLEGEYRMRFVQEREGV